MSYLQERLNQRAFPKTVFSISLNEYYGQDPEHLPLKLSLRKGSPQGKTTEAATLPDDLQGHVFIIAAAGSVELEAENQELGYILPAKGGLTSLFNGDGILYRLDFHQTSGLLTESPKYISEQGAAWLAIRLIRTPDYYLDKALYNRAHTNSVQDSNDIEEKVKVWRKLAFRTSGIARFSLILGTRNQLNTALLKLNYKAGERLLATWDNGRPFEVDPYSLGLIGAVGTDNQWIPMVSPPQQQALKPILTSAHPVFDPHTEEFFTTNVTRTLLSLLKPDKLVRHGVHHLWQLLTRIPAKSYVDLNINDENSRKGFFLNWPRRFVSFAFYCLILLPVLRLFSWLLEVMLRLLGLEQGQNQVYLALWTGAYTEESFQLFKVKLPSGRKIEQTVHQIGLTQHHIILCDTAFKVTPELFIPDFANEFVLDYLDQIRNFLTYPQLPYTRFYIVRRSDLNNSNPEVNCVEFTLPREIAHFEVDYLSSPERLVLYAANINATDPAEFIRKYDESVYDPRRGANSTVSEDILSFAVGKLKNVVQKILDPSHSHTHNPDTRSPDNPAAGHCCAPTDVNSLGCYIIDTTTGELLRPHEQSITQQINRTWALSFPAYQDNRLSHQHSQNIYWGAWGLWNDTLTADIFDMYDTYAYRQVSPDDLKLYSILGIPASISHVRIDRENPERPKISLTDNYYTFPDGHFGTSPTFIPKAHAQDDSDGYIVCTVLYSNNLASISENSEQWSQNSEIWIFDTCDLTQGPIYCLSHPQLNLGLTIHTTWLETLPKYSLNGYDVASDYASVQDQIKALNIIKSSGLEQEVDDIFHQEIFPSFNQQA